MNIKGTFRTAAGLLGLIAICALPAAADQVILDDLIVEASICVGVDCNNGESFGFDTLRLKENNLRIHFLDTSSSSSFPSTDWRITINDSSNGGLSHFSIDDASNSRTPFRIEAGAPSNSLYVDDGGRIGFGTNQPVVDLHVKSGNTPTLRLEQDGSSGFTAQTWDLAGNEANFFIRDATNGSKLPFKVKPGALTNSIFIAADGRVGFRTTNPMASLHVLESSGQAGFRLQNASTTWNTANTGAGTYVINDIVDGTNEFALTTDGNLTLEGDLITGGTGNCAPPNPACDGVFQPGYAIESIEDHAAFMWERNHLPAVGPTAAGKPINLTVKTQGILNELEKAHIYIEQLHQRLEQKDAALTDVLERLEKLEAALAGN